LSSIYDSPRLAAGYAYARPPVHPCIVQRIGARLGADGRIGRALDVGCGAGLSTAALEPLAATAVGLESVAAMLAHCRDVSSRALFLVGQAERLPFPAGTFDLLTAAGSINYADLDLFLPEAARVLAPGGVLAIYDFSAGRRLRESDELDVWYSAFERRYPPPPGYHLDPRGLAYAASGLRLDAYEEFEVALDMTLSTYLQYAMTETNVELAISRGTPEVEIHRWCLRTLAEIFADGSRDVFFDAYVACVKGATPGSGSTPWEL
jgi:ubiquinone/menaquinone biosynthesis C-methylase UbiE